MKGFSIKVVLALLMVLGSFAGFAAQNMRSLASNVHIKEINYNPNSIHHYTGFYGYQSSIVFAEDEVIDTVSMGNSTGWQLNPQGNRLFLKPIEEYAETNVTIISNKRVYHFAFHGAEAKGINDPALAYEVRFRYGSTDIDLNAAMVSSAVSNKGISGIADAMDLNFDYTIKGMDYIKPLKVFDDGRFMYLQFRDVNADLPAIFLVDSEGYESLVNFHINDNYVVVERVAPRFTLRHGSDTACIFNEKILYESGGNDYNKKSKRKSRR